MKTLLLFFALFVTISSFGQLEDVTRKPLRIIVFGAHPDDCEVNAGGLAALYVELGHSVKFVSLTNGDKGHPTISGKALAKRRLREANEAGRRLGVVYEIMDNPDGALFPTIVNRLEVIRKIRDWRADIVITHRPNDYHPDHRYTAMIVQDAAYLVIVPAILPDWPALQKNPLFLYFADRFERPNAFRPDISVDITSVFTAKIEALDAHVSQFYEWLPWTEHDESVPVNTEERKKWLAARRSERNSVGPDSFKSLQKWYGDKRAGEVKLAESFEICEYGLDPSDQDIRNLFPMFKKN